MREERSDLFLNMIRRAQRGRLKVYLGYAAGVGKTYRMLQEGHQLKAEGIDVVAGFIETHGRKETAQLVEGLQVVPRRTVIYRGVSLEEMDVDAVLARRPGVALVDEIAHTNAPGSRNGKRYEDVQELLAAGIHVVTTVNVQHMESLYDDVERATGVKVRERVPDRVLLEADQVVTIDLAPEDLRKRIEEQKVYPAERIPAALSNFFALPNLEQLREMTLRELAAQIDQRRRELELDARGSAVPDQVMVCLSSKGPARDRLLRYGSRLAGKLNRNWYAVYVQTPQESPTLIDAETQRILSETLTLAKHLGAIVFTYKGEDVAQTLLQFAKEYRVGHIVVGSPRAPSLRDRLMASEDVVQKLLRGADGATVVVLDTRHALPSKEPPEAPQEPGPPSPKSRRPSVRLAELLSERNVVLWDEPVSKGDALAALVAKSVSADAYPGMAEVLAAVLVRESQGTTFFPGIALPHTRLAGLPGPRAALGVTRGGIAGETEGQKTALVVLTLTPESAPEVQVDLLAQASRAASDPVLMKRIAAASTGSDVVTLWKAWEEGGM